MDLKFSKALFLAYYGYNIGPITKECLDNCDGMPVIDGKVRSMKGSLFIVPEHCCFTEEQRSNVGLTRVPENLVFSRHRFIENHGLIEYSKIEDLIDQLDGCTVRAHSHVEGMTRFDDGSEDCCVSLSNCVEEELWNDYNNLTSNTIFETRKNVTFSLAWYNFHNKTDHRVREGDGHWAALADGAPVFVTKDRTLGVVMVKEGPYFVAAEWCNQPPEEETMWVFDKFEWIKQCGLDIYKEYADTIDELHGGEWIEYVEGVATKLDGVQVSYKHAHGIRKIVHLKSYITKAHCVEISKSDYTPRTIYIAEELK